MNERHLCPCCGHRTYASPAGGTMQICPVCFWEDAPGERFFNGSNQVSLALGQRNFEAFGACEATYRNEVRSPTPQQARPAAWTSFEACHARILEFIEAAYADVTLDGGISMHQREALDLYCTEEQLEAAAALDPETRWQSIAMEKIQRLGMSLVFFDPRGIRFHLPAFLRCALRLWHMSKDGDCSDSAQLIYGLTDGPRPEGCYAEAFSLLNPQQHQAVAAFLRFVAAVGDSCADDAKEALRHGWDLWTPDFIQFPYNPTLEP